MSWERKIGDEVASFGVSGFLYNSHFMPYDRLTESIWSPLRGYCINGPLIDREARNISVLEITWGTWKQLFPESYVLSTETGYDRN